MAIFIDNFFDTIILFGLIAISLFYYYATATYDFWSKKGVPFEKPIPLFGNTFRSTLGLRAPYLEEADLYNMNYDIPYIGRFLLRKPVLLIIDPDLVYRVLIEDFTHFYNRGFKIDEKLDPLAMNLVNLEDQRWKNLRTKLTPVFSPGKLKTMHHKLIACSNNLRDHLAKYVYSGETFDAREVMATIATDVIGHCAFGIQMNAIKDPNSQFRAAGREVFRPTFMHGVRLMLRLAAPGLLSILNWKAYPKPIEQFFFGVIREAIATRELGKVEVQDFLQLMINLKKADDQLIKTNNIPRAGEGEQTFLLDEMVLAANAFVFFLAGFETTASTLSFCLFELSQNPDIQETLREEVDAALNKHGGQATFDAVKEMTYLDLIITETLRKYPPVMSLPRECSKDYKVPNSNLVLKKGTMISIPTYSLHHDPRYYPEPERFNPDRFSEENKKNLRKGTYMPFGDGPRICIGKRFATLEMKVVLATLVSKYVFTTNNKTKMPLTFVSASAFLVPEGGLWLNIRNR